MPTVSKKTSKKSADKPVQRKARSKKEEIKLKYSDKSNGQPQLIPIFNEIVKLLAPYAKGTMKLSGGSEGKVVLISKRAVEIFGRKRDELWFASALVQKGYVGFYYMPVYGDSEVKKMIPPQLLKCLKGKACFHIKKYDPELLSQIQEALKTGYDCWRKREWI
jgi:hypothetical protein